MDFYNKTLADFLETDLKTAQDFIHRRTKNSQKIFYLVYGDDLDQVINVDILGNIANFEATLSAVKKAFDEKKFTLAAICGCKQEEIDTYLPGFGFSTRNYELLKKVFGEHYNQPYDMSTLTLSEIPSYNQLLSLVKEKLENIKRKNSYDLSMQGKPILSFLKCSKEELEIFKARVIENRRKIRFAFYAVFGPQLDKTANILNLRQDQIADFEEGIKEGQKVIITYREEHIYEKENKEKRRRALMQKIRANEAKEQEKMKASSNIEVKENERKIFLYDILECSKEELALFISKLGYVQEPYWALRKAFGNDFLNPLDLTDMTKRELKNYDKGIKELKHFQKQYQKDQKKKLTYIVKGSREEIMAIIANIKPSTSRYKVLVKVFGPNFDQIKDLTNITPEEKVLYNDATAFIRKKLRQGKEPTQTLAQIIGCSYEKLMELLKDKNKNSAQYQALVKAHGEALDQVKNIDALIGKEKDAYNQAVCSLRKKYKNPKTEKNQAYLYRILRCKWERLENVLAQMDKNSAYYLVLAKAFNNDFKGPKVGILNAEEEKIYEEAKAYLKSMLCSAKKRINDKYLWELIGCQEQELELLLKSLPDNWSHFEALQNMFGPDLKSRKKSDMTLKSVTYSLRLLRLRYQKIIVEGQDANIVKRKTHIAKTLYDHVGCTLEDLETLIPYLSKSYVSILQSIYGNDFQKIENLSNITLEDKQKHKYILKRLRNLYQSIYVENNLNKVKKYVKESSEYLDEIIGCSKEQLSTLVSLLPENTESYQILVKVFGSDFLGKKDLSKLNEKEKSVYASVKYRLKKYYAQGTQKKSRKWKASYIWDSVGCSREEFNNLYPYLKPHHQEILQLVHGSNLDKLRDLTNLTKQDKSTYFTAKTRLKKLYQYVYVEHNMSKIQKNIIFGKEYLDEIIGCSKEELATVVGYLDKNTLSYETLVKVHGNDFQKPRDFNKLTKNEKATCRSTYRRLKRFYEQGGKKEKSEKLPKIEEDAYLKVPAIPVLIPYLEERYQQIMYIYLATQDINKVAKLMNMELGSVKKCLNLIYNWFNRVKTLYTIQFNDEFPTLEITSDNQIRRLKK